MNVSSDKERCDGNNYYVIFENDVENYIEIKDFTRILFNRVYRKVHKTL